MHINLQMAISNDTYPRMTQVRVSNCSFRKSSCITCPVPEESPLDLKIRLCQKHVDAPVLVIP